MWEKGEDMAVGVAEEVVVAMAEEDVWEDLAGLGECGAGLDLWGDGNMAVMVAHLLTVDSQWDPRHMGRHLPVTQWVHHPLMENICLHHPHSRDLDVTWVLADLDALWDHHMPSAGALAWAAGKAQRERKERKASLGAKKRARVQKPPQRRKLKKQQYRIWNSLLEHRHLF